MTESNSSTINTLLKDAIEQKFTLIGLAIAGLRDKATHSQITPNDVEVIEVLIGQSDSELQVMTAQLINGWQLVIGCRLNF